MGNCNQCLKHHHDASTSVSKKQKKGKKDHESDSSMPSSVDLASITLTAQRDKYKDAGGTRVCRYTRITYEDAFPESGGEELQYVLSQIDQEQVLTFQVHLKNFKLQNFNNVNQQLFLTTEIGEDLIEQKQNAPKKRCSLKGPEAEINLDVPVGGGILFEDQKDTQDFSKRMNLSLSYKEQENFTRWESEHFRLGLEGSVEYNDSDNHVKFETECADLRRQFYIIQIFLTAAPKKPIAYLSVEFLALALGPKKCDIDIRDIKTLKSMGRIQFEVDVRQYQTMGISLEELHCNINTKEDRPLFSQFKVITNNDVPRISDPTHTQIGRFKKDNSVTTFKWQKNPDDVFNQNALPEVHYDIAMETLKNSTIHILMSVDPQFSEHQTEKILRKMHENAIRGKTTYQAKTRKFTDADEILAEDDSNRFNNASKQHQNVKGDELSINSNKMSFNDGMACFEDEHHIVIQTAEGVERPQTAHASNDTPSLNFPKGSTSTKGGGLGGGLSQLYKRSASSKPKGSHPVTSSSPENSLKIWGNRFSQAANDKFGLGDIFRRQGTKDKKRRGYTSSQDTHESNELSKKMGSLLPEDNSDPNEAFFEELKKGEPLNNRSHSIRSNVSSSIADAVDYYRKYDDNESSQKINDHSQQLTFNVVGECYINFSKLLQSEMRKLDKRDSSILSQKMSVSVKKSNSQVRATNRSGYKLSLKLSPKNEDGEIRIERKTFSEQLWHVGKVVGSVMGVFALQNIPSVQQMQLGILTEKGVVLSAAPILLNDDKDGGFLGMLKKNNRNEQITQFIELAKKLKKIDSYKDKKQIYRTFNEKERIINDIISILADADSELAAHGNLRMFKYSNELDMIRGQQAFIELGFHCLMFADVTRYEFRRDYYEMLSQVFLRDELNLNNVALLPEEMEAIMNTRIVDVNLIESYVDQDGKKINGGRRTQSSSQLNNMRGTVVTKKKDNSPQKQRKQLLLPPESVGAKNQQAAAEANKGAATEDPEDLQFERVKQEKVKIAQYYQKLLYQILDDCLNKFYRKDVEPYLRSYLEICISICFFRVPRFQQLFLNCVNSQSAIGSAGPASGDHSRGKTMGIPEWRNLNWEIDEDSGISHHSVSNGETGHGLVKLFDWNVHFYSHIPVSDEYIESMKQLSRIENNKKWQARVKKRSLAYFQIIRRWANYIKTTVQTNNLFWQDIPGYRIIVKSILLELKQRSITEYPDSLIETTLELIQNPELLTVIMTIVFQKTNAYDSATLCTTMGLITKWMNHIEKQGLAFPSNFDFSFFIKGITVSLEMDHSLSTPRTINLLYRTLHYFPIEQRSVIVQEIFQKFFYQLFFNWAYNVRDIFIAFLLYQIEYLYIFRTTSYLTLAMDHQIQTPTRNSASPFGRNNAYQLLSIRSNTQEFKVPSAEGGGTTGATNGQISPADGAAPGQLSIQMIKINWKENFKKFASVIEQFEKQLQQNPIEAEEYFDMSVSLKRFRVTSEMMGMGNKSMKIQTHRQESTQQSLLQFSKYGGTAAQEKNQQFARKKNILQGSDKRKLQNQGFTLAQFIKSHDYYKRFVQDIETLEDYYKSQASLKPAPDGAQVDTRSAAASSNTTTQDLEKRYRKIMGRIPRNLHIYVPQALEDFNRQLEEYEQWRQQAVASGAQKAIFKAVANNASDFTILNILPEFNMEKNMPVEDDDNLERKEEW